MGNPGVAQAFASFGTASCFLPRSIWSGLPNSRCCAPARSGPLRLFRGWRCQGELQLRPH